MIVRLITGIIFCLAVLILPWWLLLVFGGLLVIVYKNFYELILMALALDLLYGAPSSKFWGFRFALTALAIITTLLATTLRRRLKNHLYV